MIRWDYQPPRMTAADRALLRWRIRPSKAEQLEQTAAKMRESNKRFIAIRDGLRRWWRGRRR